MIKSTEFINYKIRPSKHFTLGWMRKWGWDMQDLKNALEYCHKIDKVGKTKYEVYTKYRKTSKKIIFILDEEYKEILIITGAEGK